MHQETFPVRPLGKYGYVYLLDKPTRRLYRLWNVTVGIIMTMLAIAQIIAPRILKPLPWPPNFPLLLMISAIVLGISGMLAIASRGKIVSQKEAGTIDPANQYHSAPVRSLFGIYKWNIYISAGILLSASILYILSALLTNTPIDYSVLLPFLIPSSGVFIFIIVRRYLS